MARLERVLWIDAQVRSGRHPNLASVMARWEVSRGTAHGDYRYLKDRLDAPLAFDREHGGWVYTDPTFALPSAIVSESEATALQRALLVAREHLNPAATAGLDAFADWLAPYLPARSSAAESAGGGSELSGGVGVSPDLLRACVEAIRVRRKLHLRYHGAHRDQDTERTVHPYHLHHWRAEPYLLTWDELRQDWRTFLLSRVTHWRTVGEEAAFVRDPAFDAQALLERGFGLLHGADLTTVRVRFSPYQARWVRERRYHPSQQNEEQADGSLILTLNVAGTAEVKRWVLGYGREAEVLEPAALRAEIATEAKDLEKIYGGERSVQPI
jgi:predicted DNA-binding transcriptional regulator YafY